MVGLKFASCMIAGLSASQALAAAMAQSLQSGQSATSGSGGKLGPSYTFTFFENSDCSGNSESVTFESLDGCASGDMVDGTFPFSVNVTQMDPGYGADCDTDDDFDGFTVNSPDSEIDNFDIGECAGGESVIGAYGIMSFKVIYLKDNPDPAYTDNEGSPS